MHKSALERQIIEGILIMNDKSDHILNSKSEFSMNHIVAQHTKYEGRGVQSARSEESEVQSTENESVHSARSPRKKIRRIAEEPSAVQSATEKPVQSQSDSPPRKSSLRAKVQDQNRVQRARLRDWLNSAGVHRETGFAESRRSEGL